MNRSILALAAALVAAPAVAQMAAPAAPPAPMPPMAMHKGMMADGVMTLAEVQARVAQMFARRDANKDGALTAEEMAPKGEMKRIVIKDGAPGAMPEGMPGMEHEGPMRDPAVAFNRLDTNHDGMLSRDEFAKGREIRIERRVEMRGPNGEMMKMRHPGMGMMGGHLFQMADTNHDGRVTLAEAQATAAQHFAMADTNRDGKVTHDEMRAMHEKMMPAMGEHMKHAG